MPFQSTIKVECDYTRLRRQVRRLLSKIPQEEMESYKKRILANLKWTRIPSRTPNTLTVSPRIDLGRFR